MLNLSWRQKVVYTLNKKTENKNTTYNIFCKCLNFLTFFIFFKTLIQTWNRFIKTVGFLLSYKM